MMSFPSHWTEEQKQRFDVYLPYLGTRRLMQEIPCIHVAGTNGKGSVCAMLESMLRQAGYRTGLFTSPHLYHETERILIDGRPIDPAYMQEGMEHIAAILPSAGYFERTFFCAMEAFAASGCEIAVIEAGIGGAMDVTNLVAPWATVIANVGLDHTAVLGDTLEKIAQQKAGIAKRSVPMVLYSDLPKGVHDAIVSVCRNAGAPIYEGERIRIIQQDGALHPVLTFQTDKGEVGPLTLPLMGAHQVKNAQLALAAMMALEGKIKATEEQLAEGLRTTRWPGRMQWMPTCGTGPQILVDGAHNPQAALQLKENIQRLFGKSPVVLLCAVMRDKNTKEVVRQLNEIAEVAVCTVPEPQRGTPPQDLAALFSCPAEAEPDAAKAYARACEAARHRGALLVVAGSLYLPGAIGIGSAQEG